MALMAHVIQELQNVLMIPNPTNLDVYIKCSCTRLPIAQQQIPAGGIPYIELDLSNERICLALSANSETYMQRIKDAATRIAHADNIYLPDINYGCPYYNAIQNNLQIDIVPPVVPAAVPAAED